MAEVFLARSVGAEGLEKRLVIKKILPHLASSDHFVEMFIQEAKVAMGLNHPNIVQVYDFGKVGRDYYLAMEFVDGVELSRLLQAGRDIEQPLAVGDAVYVAVEVARGLDYIHRRESAAGEQLGLVHRDISPQNVMISWDGAVKIVDFGIASSMRERQQEEDELRGKYRYMSPEEARGEEIDARSDLFSLGAVLFEMLCGRQLFRGEQPREVLDLVESAVVPDISTLNPDLPDRLEHALYKMLAAQPDRRFEDARSLQLELTRMLYGMAQVHDAATLADYVSDVDEQLAGQESGLGNGGGGIRTSAEQTAPSFAVARSRGMTTPGLDDSVGADDGRRHTRMTPQRKAVGVVAGQFRAGGHQRDRGDSARKDHHVIKSIAFKNDAVVESLEDDRFTLLMGIPVSDETDAERAVRVALEIKEAFDARSTGFGEDVDIHLAVATGEVIFRQHVGSQQRAFDWTLQPASRRQIDELLERSDETAIVADMGIYRRVRRSFDCTVLEQLDDQEQAGQPRRIYRVEGEKTPSTQIRELRRSLDAFYGREIPRRRLRNNLRQTVLEQRARALIFLGPPGVGKSTLVEEFLQGLDSRDVRVVRGVASPLHRDVPLASAAALFAELLGVDLEAPAERVVERLECEIEELFAQASQREREWLVDSLSRIFAIGTSPGKSAGSAGEQRRHIFAAIRRLMNRFARAGRPLVFAIDDIHHVDSVMLAFAAEYFDRNQRVPVFFVGTGRDIGSHLESRAWKELTEAQNVTFERLDELAVSDAERMVHDLLLSYGSEDESLAQLVLEHAGGNPLHIREVVDTLVEHNVLSDSSELQQVDNEEFLAPSLEGLIRARIDRLPVEHREVLTKISLLPSPFDLDHATAICEGDIDGIVDDLVDAGMLQPVGGENDRVQYRFSGTVIREVASRRLIPRQAQQLHERIADMLMEQHDHADSALIARHLDEAGQSQRALQLYEEAVERAFRQFGAGECLRLCDRIIEHQDVTDDQRFRALQWRCRALERLGARDEAEEALEQLEELAPEVGEPHQQAQVAIRRARLHIDRGEFEPARRAVAKALQIAGEHDDDLERANAWRLEAVIELGEGNRDRALALIDRAIATLNFGSDQRAREALVEAYNARGVILRQSGRHREAIEAYDTALAATGNMETSPLKRQLLLNSGLALAYLGEFSEAKSRYEESLEMSRRLGYRRDEALVLVNLGHLYEILGRYDKAIRHVRRGIVLGRRTDTPHTVADGEITIGLARLRKGELQVAERHITKGLQLAESLPNSYLITCARLGLCEVDLERGDQEAIQRVMERAGQVREDCEEAGMMWAVVVAHGLLAEALKQQGDIDEALEHSEQAVEMLDEVKLLGGDQILVNHIELLEHQPQRNEERNQCIRRAVKLYQTRLDSIDDEKDREAFGSLPISETIEQLRKELAEQPSSTPTSTG